jgi:hypothetical protein
MRSGIIHDLLRTILDEEFKELKALEKNSKN